MGYTGAYDDGYSDPGAAAAGVTGIVEIAFTTLPAAAATWTDVSTYVRNVTVTRGRNRELDVVQAGRATVILDNQDRRFDPTYTAGPYYPNVVPMRRLRVRNYYAGTAYTVFSGYIDGWDQGYSYPRDATVSVTATDGYKALTAAQLPGSVWDVEVGADNPYAWWKLGEPASSTVVFDAVTGNRGAVSGTPTFGTASLVVGESGTAAAFAKADNTSEVRVSSGRIVPSAFPFTVELWFKVTTSDLSVASYNWLFDVRSSPASSAFQWPSVYVQSNTATTGTLYAYCGNLGVRGVSQAIALNTLYHVVYVATSASTMALYINGSTTGTVSVGTPGGGLAPTPITATIGNDSYPHAFGSYVFPGTVDEVVIYDTALSAARVSAHYTAGTAPWSGDLSGTRVGRVLDAVGWSTSDRNIDAGNSTLQAETSFTGTALAKLQQVEASENGLLFMGVDGKVRFRSRQNGWQSPYTTIQGTFGDGASELDYADIDFDYDDTQIYNDIRVTRDGGIEQRVEDQTSEDAYLTRTLTKTGLQVSTDSESYDAATYLLARYKDAALRVKELVVKPQKDPTNLYPQVLGRELGDRLRVLRRPQSVGSAIDQEVMIEGIAHTVTPETWTTTWQVSPIDATRYWLVGTAGNSELDTTTRLGY